jgi:hypothetical protein
VRISGSPVAKMVASATIVVGKVPRMEVQRAEIAVPRSSIAAKAPVARQVADVDIDVKVVELVLDFVELEILEDTEFVSLDVLLVLLMLRLLLMLSVLDVPDMPDTPLVLPVLFTFDIVDMLLVSDALTVLEDPVGEPESIAGGNRRG